MFNLSVVIPALNEEKNLPKLVDEIVTALKKTREIKTYEIIVVDDHSSDNTFLTVKKMTKTAIIKAVRLSRRSGSHIALRAGLKVAKGDLVLCLSADGQDDPVVLDDMLEKVSGGANIVWAVRKSRNEPFMEKMLAKTFYKILYWFSEVNNPQINLENADFYLLDRKVVKAINNCEERNTSLFGLILWLGFNQDYVLYNRRERISGKSKWNFKSKMRLAKDWFISFSGLPLRFISFFGGFVALIGMLYAIFIFIYAILGYSRPGWAETAITLLITSGVQMIMLGVVGEYLWRTLDETRKRPIYFIEKTIGL